MKHKVMTEEEVNEAGLLQPGIYDFEILNAEETKSSKEDDMFALKLNVFDSAGEGRTILDWVLPSFAKKYKHLHDACGLMDLYQSGETKADDLVGKTGKLKLVVGKPYTDKNGNERVNNSVEDYIKKENMVLDDEVPF